MVPPKDKTVIEGEMASYWMGDVILVSLSKSPQRTVANISSNIALVKQITHNKKTPLLIYLSNSPVPDKATRILCRAASKHLLRHGNGIKTWFGQIHYEHPVCA